MAVKGGKRPGAGRPKGSLNKTTTQAKEAIETVFASLQESDETSLEGWAKSNLGDFYKLIFPKLLPVQVSGDPENPIRTVSELVLRGVRSDARD